MDFFLQSSDFTDNTTIPRQYTCQGDDVSPNLTWHGAPQETKTYVLIVDDPDAPMGTWTHWVLFNIPDAMNALNSAADTPPGATTSLNSWGTIGYRGPCPPSGEHRYFFKMYALNASLNLTMHASKKDVEEAMQAHIVGTAQLIGLYQKT